MPENPVDEEIQHVSDTALLIAAFRAQESERPDALFKDPLAGKLTGARGQAIAAAHPQGYVTGWMTAIRTVIIDEMIRARVAQGCDTVLNLGAGLDTRPYRLALPPSLRWIEADYPHMIDLKNRVLAAEKPACRLERFAVDLADGEARRRFLSEAAGGGNVLVLTEGVVLYLDESEAGGLADDLRASAAVRAWIVDYFAPQALKFRGRAFRRRMEKAPFKFAPADWQGFFASHGWETKEMRYIPEEAERLKRPMPLKFPVKLLFILKALAMGKRGREMGKKFMGYAILEKRR